MIKRSLHILLLWCTAIAMLTSCDKKKVDWNVRQESKNKKPYDTYLARQSLRYFFPEAQVSELSRSYRFGSLDTSSLYNSSGTSLMILVGIRFEVSEKEWQRLKAFVREGNELVVFAGKYDPKIEEAFHLHKTVSMEMRSLTDNDVLNNQHALTLAADPFRKYGYRGRSIDGYFVGANDNLFISKLLESRQKTAGNDTANTVADSSVVSEGTSGESDNSGDDEESSYLLADTLGYANGHPDCIRIAMGRGHITLHAAPLVTSNYFLLQQGNIDYLGGLWSTLPANINRIYWDDYFMHSSVESSSNALWKYPATRYGLFLGIFIIGVYIVFQMKRRQRIVPIIPPLKNESVSFVETVGRLYYNKGDNANLADKMVQQFLEWVRINCYINTNRMNEDFVQQLAMKTGRPLNAVSELVNMIHEVRLRSVNIDDPYLYQLYRTIQEFYKKH